MIPRLELKERVRMIRETPLYDQTVQRLHATITNHSNAKDWMRGLREKLVRPSIALAFIQGLEEEAMRDPARELPYLVFSDAVLDANNYVTDESMEGLYTLSEEEQVAVFASIMMWAERHDKDLPFTKTLIYQSFLLEADSILSGREKLGDQEQEIVERLKNKDKAAGGVLLNTFMVVCMLHQFLGDDAVSIIVPIDELKTLECEQIVDRLFALPPRTTIALLTIIKHYWNKLAEMLYNGL